MDIKTFRDQTAIERNLRSNATNINLVAFRADEEQLYVNDLRADESALDTVYNMLGISRRYARKLPLRLMMPHIEYQARNVDKIVHMVSLNDALVGFSGAQRFNPLYHSTILDAAEDVIGPEANAEDILYSLNSSSFIVTNGVCTEPKVGDITKAGILVKNSILGLQNPEFSLVAKRLVCTNGMVRTETITRIGVYDRSMVPDTIERLWSQAQNFVDEFGETYSVPVQNNPAVLASFLAHHRVGGRIIGKILEAVENAKPATLYDLINVITYIGTHETRGRWLQQVLQGLGAQLAHEYRTCDECHNILV